MGFFKSKKGSIISEYFKLLEPVGNYEADTMCEVALYDGFLEITAPFYKNKITLSYSKITDIFHGPKTNLIQKDKSVIGRALGGGILFGGAGAVVGAISGTNGKKTVKQILVYFIISYKDSDGNEKFLQFEDTRNYHGKSLASKLMELCNLDKAAPQDINL